MRLFKLLPLLLLLTACYHPLYGEKSVGSAEPTAQEAKLNSIFIAPMDDENGQKLRNFLIDRMYNQGRPARTDYRLDVTLTQAQENIGLQKNGVTARARVTLTVNYKLTETATRKVLLTASNKSVVSFNLLDEQYATLSSRETAVSDALTELSDRITNRLLVYFDEGK